MNKNRKGETSNPLMVILFAMILVLLAMAFINSVADTKSSQTSLTPITGESYNLLTRGCYPAGALGTVNITDADCNITVSAWYPAEDWRLSESQCDLSNVVVTNNTGTVLEADTDYTLFADTGIIQLLNTSTLYNSSATMNNNLLKVNYDYCSSGYLTSSGDRGIANLWVTLMILTLIGVLIGVVVKLWNN